VSQCNYKGFVIECILYHCPAANLAAEKAAAEAEEKLQAGSERVELDEFGRDVNVARRKEVLERAARRKARLEAQHQRQKKEKVWILQCVGFSMFLQTDYSARWVYACWLPVRRVTMCN
jgi:hypothetical protein